LETRNRPGAVGALEGVKLASSVARLVMLHTDHVLLAGEGAGRFARAHGFPEENLLTDFSRRVWLYGRGIREGQNPEASLDEWGSDVRTFIEEHRAWLGQTGTIHLSARSASGDLACCTSTSGLPFKLPGRIADSALVGAGLYCDNEVASVGCTGRGESAILSNASAAAVNLMRSGLSPLDSALEVLETTVRLRSLKEITSHTAVGLDKSSVSWARTTSRISKRAK
jgi:N4-(beta-N-acetylglucosaminyl)-L-asparaginase